MAAMIARTYTTMPMATAQGDTMTTTMATNINDDDNDDNDDKASLTTSNKGDNHNCDDSKDACASTETTPVHQ
jgi:hypothetical protein